MEQDSMSMGSTRSSAPSSSRRRSWSPLEEKILMTTLKEIVSEGWKSENGFRSGYLGYLEKIIHRTLPQTNLKAEPHISSKIHVWKKIHGSLTSILSRSGFSWVESSHMLFIEDESIWKEYIRTDTYVKRLRNKSFPFFNDWTKVFGKDRATGEHVEDPGAAAASNLNVDDDVCGTFPNEMCSDDEEIMSPAYKEPVNQAPGSSGGKAKSGGKKKRKLSVEPVSESMVNLMGKFCDQASERLQEIASKIGYEYTMSSKREKLFEAISKLGVLSADDVLVVVRRLAGDLNDLDLFFTLPPEEQSRMVLMMVTGRY